MGRPRKRPGKPSGTVGKDDRVNVIVLKGSREYAEWFEAAHRSTHIPKSSIVRLALVDWAQMKGLPPPPEM